jgi:glycosyltransferase involved in cell wall biosynthesis
VVSTDPSDDTARADVTRHTPPRPKLSIVMPAYNEEQTIASAIASVLGATYPCDFELIVVDDGSSDGTSKILSALRHPKAQVISHPRNLGKGAALQTGACVATGTHFVPFDADLEYDATDLAALIRPVLQGRCAVVYGSRLFGANTRYQSYRHAIGNRALTLVANVLFDSYLSDIHTCLKLLPVELFRELGLTEDGFGLDTEITAKLLARGITPFEVPVSYHSRSVQHGKKITWRDGVECLQVLARVRSGARSEGQPPLLVNDPLDALAASMTILAEIETVEPRIDELEPESSYHLARQAAGR